MRQGACLYDNRVIADRFTWNKLDCARMIQYHFDKKRL